MGNMQQDMSKASPAHSLSTSLSTPPSSPPDINNSRRIEDELLEFIQPDLKMQSVSRDWDSLELDLFGEDLKPGTAEADAFFDSAFYN
jgi:hypothetical protein